MSCPALRLRTARPGLVLVGLSEDDADAYYELLDRNREHLSRLGDYQEEKDATPEWVAAHLRLVHDGSLRLGVHLAGRLIGRVDLVAVDPPKYALGYWLDHCHLRQGIATVACSAVIDYARETVAATELFAGVTHGNDASVALLGRLGFRPVVAFERYTRFHLPVNQG